MIKEIQKRPFVRPLLLWITGILLQPWLPLERWSFILLLLPIGILFYVFTHTKGQMDLAYHACWVWGTIFVALLFFLAVQATFYTQQKGYLFAFNIPGQESLGLLKNRLLASFDQLALSEKERSVLQTVTFGYKQELAWETRQQFSMTGVAHILAVSGFHVAIVCSFLSWLLFFLPASGWGNRIRYIVTILFLWIFVILTGLSPSAVRAGIMLSLYLTGKQLRRRADGYNTWAAAAFLMLVYNPWYLFDIGFQLSYLAVLSIQLFVPVYTRWEIRNPLVAIPWNWMILSLAAQTGVTFLCLYYFGYFPLLFLLTNIPLTFLVTLLIPVTFLWLFLPSWLPGYGWLTGIVEGLCHSMTWVVEAFSRIPHSTLIIRFDKVLLLLSYAGLFIVYKK